MSRLVPIKANPSLKGIVQHPIVEITRKGNLLCYESCGGRWFRSDRWDVEDGLAQIQGLFENLHYANLNDLYRCLGIYETTKGSIYGWNYYIHGPGEILKVQLIENGFKTMDEPVLVISPVVFPEKNYKEGI